MLAFDRAEGRDMLQPTSEGPARELQPGRSYGLIRTELGFAGQDDRDMEKMLSQGYRGGRYSFGYPACPRLEDQAPLLKLLDAERLGVTISDEWQLHPEQSTSAIVLHHPRAKYFSV